MYVEDIDDLDELSALLAEAEDRYNFSYAYQDIEQAEWDMQDIQERINELQAMSETGDTPASE